MTAALPDPRTLAHSVFLSAHLAEFLSACARESLPVIVLKGAALAETVYPHPGLRGYRDIDMLVRPADAGRAQGILHALGYAVSPAHWESLVSGQDCQADFSKETPGGPVILELHTNLVNNDLLWGSVRVDLDGLWQRAEPILLANTPTLMLGPEDQTLHLCLHLAGHYFDAPRSVQDIWQVCQTRALDWDLLTRFARRADAGTLVFLGLRLAAVPVPDSFPGALAPRPAWRRRLLERWTLSPPLDNRHRLGLLLLLLDSPLAPLRVLRRALFPTRRWLLDHYAPGAEPAPSRLALSAAHARFLWQAMIGNASSLLL